jgi:hypothetical protein
MFRQIGTKGEGFLAFDSVVCTDLVDSLRICAAGQFAFDAGWGA